MCASDVTPVVWQWNIEKKKAEERDDVVHVCRDFGRIRQWAEGRWMESLKKEDFEVYALPGEGVSASQSALFMSYTSSCIYP